MRASRALVPPDRIPVGPDTRVRLHPLVVVREPGRDPMLGCERARRYLEVDDDTLAAVTALLECESVGAAERLMLDVHGEEWDVAALVETLAERGFVAMLDDVALEEFEAPGRHRILRSVAPEQLGWLRSRALGTAWCVVVGSWLAGVLTSVVALPSPGALRFSNRPLLVPLVVFAVLLGSAYLHELAHFFVARSYGVDAAISFSRRFHIAVLQTDVTNAWRLPPRQRLAIFGAGAAWNLLVVAACGLASVVAGPSLRVALALVAYTNALPLVFQLLFFARTDLYFALLVVTGERNLRGDARAYLRFAVRRAWRRLRRTSYAGGCDRCGRGVFADDPWCPRCGLARRVDDPNQWAFGHASRRRLLAYAIATHSFQLAALAYFVTVGLHLQFTMGSLGVRALSAGLRGGEPFLVLEALLFTVIYLAQVGLLLWVLTRFLVRLVAVATRAVRRVAIA